MKNAITNCMIAVSFLAMFTGCLTERKAQKRIVRIHVEQPQVLASACATIYPPLEFTKDSIIFIPGETSWRYDTVEVDCDSVVRIGMFIRNDSHTQTGLIGFDTTRLKKVRIPCPPCPIRVDTFYRNTQTQAVNKARETELELQVADIKDKNFIIAKGTVWFLCAAFALVLIFIYILKRRFN